MGLGRVLYSLRWRLLLSFMAVIAVAVGAVAFFAERAAQRELRRVQEEAQGRRVERVQTLLNRLYGEHQEWEQLQPRIEDQGEVLGQRLVVVELRGRTVVADSGRTLLGSQVSAEAWQRIVRQGDGVVPILGPGGRPVAVLLRDPGPLLESAEPTVALVQPNLAPYLVVGGLIAGVVAVVLTLILSRRIVGPVEALARAARDLARGDFSARVPEGSRDEVGELARTFNAMAEELSRTEALRRSLVADVAHELRSPLTNLLGYLEALRDGVVQPDPPVLASLHQEVQTLVRLVEDLQELALAESGQLPLYLQRCDLAEVVRHTVTASQALAEQRGLALAVQVPGAVEVEADPERIGQVVRNLVSNALSYTPAGGRVVVALRDGAGEARVAVSDTGPGIAPEELPRVFERFYRVDRSRSRATGGSGLGLTIARRLAEAHGGRIEVESEVGRGSTFTLVLPRARPTEPRRLAAPESLGARPA